MQEDTHGNGMYSHSQKAFHVNNLFMPGIVTDNRVPECLGRVRVQLDLLSPGCVSPWYPMGGRWTGGGHGFWTLPDIGTQVLVAFPDGDKRHGIVLGCLYDEKHLPPRDKPGKENRQHAVPDKKPPHRDNRRSGQGRNKHRKRGWKNALCPGQEEWNPDSERARGHKNKLQKAQDRIRQECRAGRKEEGVCLLRRRSRSKQQQGNKNNMRQECWHGREGHKTCRKQRRVRGRKADGGAGRQSNGHGRAHNGIPSGPGTTTAPLPHPFIGKLNDGLSDDVSIDNMSRCLCSFNCNNINQ